MSKDRVLVELRRVIEGRTRKTSAIVREFKTCPHFRQCCQILSRALQRGTSGRSRPLVKTPAGVVPPGWSVGGAVLRYPPPVGAPFNPLPSPALQHPRAFPAYLSYPASPGPPNG